METIILDLDVHDVNSLVLEPAFNYENIFQRTNKVYKIVVGVTKYKMLHLSRPGNNLQPKSGCKTWNPNVNFNLRPWEIDSCEFELNMEYCLDEFDEACLRNLKPVVDSYVGNRIAGDRRNNEVSAGLDDASPGSATSAGHITEYLALLRLEFIRSGFNPVERQVRKPRLKG